MGWCCLFSCLLAEFLLFSYESFRFSYLTSYHWTYEKPHVENNHTLFRSIVPKGTSFDRFTQQTVDVIFSHVNAVARKQFNGKSAYDMFAFTYSASLASVLGISYIQPKDVIQSPRLLNLLLK